MSSFDICVFGRLGRAGGGFDRLGARPLGTRAPPVGRGAWPGGLACCREVRSAAGPFLRDHCGPAARPRAASGLPCLPRRSLLCPREPGVGFPVAPAAAGQDARSLGGARRIPTEGSQPASGRSGTRAPATGQRRGVARGPCRCQTLPSTHVPSFRQTARRTHSRFAFTCVFCKYVELLKAKNDGRGP